GGETPYNVAATKYNSVNSAATSPHTELGHRKCKSVYLAFHLLMLCTANGWFRNLNIRFVVSCTGLGAGLLRKQILTVHQNKGFACYVSLCAMHPL
ncbi:MAG: hypothetical protein QXO49_05420, partial [Candidatus Bathyarchaeia archaeon]